MAVCVQAFPSEITVLKFDTKSIKLHFKADVIHTKYEFTASVLQKEATQK